MKNSSNIVLIGMPGSGKSTVGVVLAKYARRPFIDTDILIQSITGRSLQDIVDNEGYMELRRIEEEVILSTAFHSHVIATGGSAVYSARAMGHLKKDGVIIFLDASIDVLSGRIQDFNTRGLSKSKDMSFSDLFAERMPLYRMYADITIDCTSKSHEMVSWEIIDAIKSLPIF
jgi:shikimate kinase